MDKIQNLQLNKIANEMFATTTEEQIKKLAENPRINRNWLESEAYKAGIDFDHIRGYDDGEEPRFNHNEE